MRHQAAAPNEAVQLCRLFEQERERMSAEFSGAMQASAARHEAQVRSLLQERRQAEEDTARQHGAAVQSMQQAHKLEQVAAGMPLPDTPCQSVNHMALYISVFYTLAHFHMLKMSLQHSQRLYDNFFRPTVIVQPYA